MTREQFDKLIEDEAKNPMFRELVELYRGATDVYKQNKLLAKAVNCLCCLIAHGHAVNADYENLAEILEDIKNPVLSDYIRTLVEL